MKSSVLGKIASILIFVAVLGVLYYVAKNFKDAQMIIQKAGIAGPAVAILLYALFAPTPVSTDPLTLVCGAMYGPVYGTAISWAGNNFAALVEYYLGSRIRYTVTGNSRRKKLPFGLDKLPINSPWVLIFGRMIPLYGSKVISIMAGMNRVPIKTYLWTSALVNVFGSVMLAYGGDQLFWLLRR